MKQIAAIVAAAFDADIRAREFSKEHVRYQDGERALQSAEKRTESLREEQRRRRVALGLRLIEDKGRIKHGGWLPYLEKLGVPNQTANVWMREAGFVEESAKFPASENGGNLNPRVAAGIDKRPRKRDEEPDPPAMPQEDWQREIETRKSATPQPSVEEPNLFASWKRNINRALVALPPCFTGELRTNRIPRYRTRRTHVRPQHPHDRDHADHRYAPARRVPRSARRGATRVLRTRWGPPAGAGALGGPGPDARPGRGWSSPGARQA